MFGHIISVKSVCLGRLGKTLITWLLLMCNPVGAISGVRTPWCYIVSSWVKLCLLWPWLMMTFKWLMVLLSCFWKTYESGAKMQNLMVYKLLMISLSCFWTPTMWQRCGIFQTVQFCTKPQKLDQLKLQKVQKTQLQWTCQGRLPSICLMW